jgi:hypothetical protein
MNKLLATHALASLACALIPFTSIVAQQPAAARDTVLDTRLLPSEVEREVTEAFNSASTVRATGAYEIETGRVVPGDVAVLNGPLTIAGRVNGRVIAINSDVILKPGARVEGQILVVGGNVDGKDDAFIGGDVRTYKQRLAYRQEGDHLIASGSAEEDARWWRRRQKWGSHNYSQLRLVSAKTYNRVEGLPILIGPSFGRRFGEGRFEVNALGIFRTGDELNWNSNTVGHSLKTELSLDRRGPGLAIGGRLFDIVDPAEAWQLSDTEVGLASFFLHRDFRDYFDRHGGSGYVRVSPSRSVNLTASLSDERWGSRETFDPFTLFRNGQDWRPNPTLDDATFHITNGTLRIDTRTDDDDPRSGWKITADYEYGTGTITSYGPTSPGVRDDLSGATAYSRGFLDLRRYNRISPEGQLNLRVVAGGWLNGDELPLQRRFSLGGPGALDGYPFRRTGSGEDVRQCSSGGEIPLGVPAQCERMVLLQAEYRGDLWMSLFGDLDFADSWHSGGWKRRAQWVVFADAGRGWLVGDRSGDLQYPRDEFPSLGTFKTDLGIGFDAGLIGLYVAKSVSDSKEPPNFFVRVGRRF